MKKNGFTLAETLVTIGIVGIVAAVTIPTLVNNTQNKVWAKLLATQVTSLETSIKVMMMKKDVNDIYDTIFYDNAFNIQRYPEEINCLESYIDNMPFNYFYDNEVFTIEKGPTMDSNSYNFFKLKKGGVLSFKSNQNSLGTKHYKYTEAESLELGTYRVAAADVFIDVNGKQLPNTFGRDIFMFHLDEKGRLHAKGSQEYASYFEKDEYYWQDACSDTNKGDGSFCTGRLVENDYIMDY